MAEFIMKYWLEVVFGLLISGFSWLIIQFKALKLGMQAILRDRIIEQYNKWIERKYIPIYALENVTAMYKQYHKLGGNGTITELYEELQELPHRKQDIKGSDSNENEI